METGQENIAVEPNAPAYPTKKYSNVTHAFKSLNTGTKYKPEEDSDDNKTAKALFLKWDKFFREEEKEFKKNYPLAYAAHHAKLKAQKQRRQANKRSRGSNGGSSDHSDFVVPQDERRKRIIQGRLLELVDTVEQLTSVMVDQKKRFFECLVDNGTAVEATPVEAAAN